MVWQAQSYFQLRWVDTVHGPTALYFKEIMPCTEELFASPDFGGHMMLKPAEAVCQDGRR